MAELGQPGPADGDAGVGETLVLAVEREVPGELVDQQAGQEADVGAAAVDDPDRRRRAKDGLILLELDHRPPVVEHDGATGALCEAVAVLVADDLEVVRGEPLRFRCSQFDDLDRNPCGIEERQAVITGLGRLRGRAPGVGRDRAFDRCRRRSGLFRCQHLAQTHLAAGGIDDPAFALRAEDLTLEPVELVLENIDFPAQRPHQIDNLLRAERGGLIEAGNTGRGRRIHTSIIPEAWSPPGGR